MDTLNLVYHKTDEKAISSHTLSSDVAELRSPDKAFPEQLAEIEQAIIEINEKSTWLFETELLSYNTWVAKFTSDERAEVAELADAQASGACGR